MYDRYYWLGVYTFSSKDYHPEIINNSNKSTQALLHKIYYSVAEPNFNIDSLCNTEKEKLAEAVQDGLISKTSEGYKPNFVVMTPEQLSKL